PALYGILHSLVQGLAQAIKQRYPNAKLGFGPPTDTGFFYDFDLGDDNITEEDLRDSEKRMKKIIRQRQVFKRVDMDATAAMEKLKAVGESYKDENIENLRSRGETNFSFYENAEFADLCEGPHVENTGA